MAEAGHLEVTALGGLLDRQRDGPSLEDWLDRGLLAGDRAEAWP